MHSQSSLDMSASVAELWAEKRTAQMPLVGQPSRCHIYMSIRLVMDEIKAFLFDFQ